ncbi:MAG TPA: hypothetical protein VFL51_16865 [Pseudolabrys sp.]|nr:hypothetical protein [Pseudolabrys sp.]
MSIRSKALTPSMLHGSKERAKWQAIENIWFSSIQANASRSRMGNAAAFGCFFEQTE